MKRPVDLSSISSFEDTTLLKKYCNYMGLSQIPKELPLFQKFITNMGISSHTDCCYLDYSIPQISKEFDLLRFSKSEILNVEFKSRPIPRQKIEKQLIQNKNYLNSLPFNQIASFSYVVDGETSHLYKLSEDNKLVVSTPVELMHHFESIGIPQKNIDDLFDPCQYLVSPFNDTQRFLRGAYFLTDQQAEFEKNVETSQNSFFSIAGGAGTGKTLLAYDIAKNMMNNHQNVCVVHCGIINDGQDELVQNGWVIWDLKKFMRDYAQMSNYDFIVIDEAQRIGEKINEVVRALRGSHKVIFSGDSKQWLHKSENGDKTFDEILKNVPPKNQVTLTKKIRTNHELAAFVRELFNQSDKTQHSWISAEHIHCEYFNSEEKACAFANILEESGWTVINQTTSLYDPEFYDAFDSPTTLNSHHVIGQEFDRVAVFIGPGYQYVNQKLRGTGTYYDSEKLLFENITRARREVFLIFINNPEMLNACLQILIP